MSNDAATRTQPRNALGTAGFVLGLIGLIFAPIPLVGVVAWPLVILGLIFSILGFFRARKGEATNKGLAIGGIACSAVGLVICIIWAAAFGEAANEVEREMNESATIQYEVTGDAQEATISYTTFDGGDGMSTSQETVSELPWSTKVEASGLGKGGTLTVTTGAQGGSVTCKVTIDGEEKKTAEGSGEFATASCSGF